MTSEKKKKTPEVEEPQETAGTPNDAQAQEPTDGAAPRQHGPAYYYDRRRPAHYGGPNYYGGANYYYGAGNAYSTALPYYSPGTSAGDDESSSSMLGPLSISRVIRVVFQKWPTLVVAILLGLGVGFAYYKTAPVTFKATALIEMNVRSGSYVKTQGAEINSPDEHGTAAEILNTRLAQLRGPEVIKLVAERVRADYPSLKTMTDGELYAMIGRGVEFNIQRNSRLVLVSASNSKPEIAQSIANAYAHTAHAYSVDQTKDAAEASVDWLKSRCEAYKAEKERAETAILQFRKDNQLDVLLSQNESLKLEHNQFASELAQAELRESHASDLLAVLTTIQQDPEKIGALPENVPRADEIRAAQAALRSATANRDALLQRYTDKHPDVEKADATIKTLQANFQDAVWRSREAAAANLALMKKQTESIREKDAENLRKRVELDGRISETESRLTQLQQARQMANENYSMIVHRIEEVRLSSEDTHATVRVMREASLPTRQISPDPRVAFSAGPIIGLVIGFVFILVLDRIEDKITSSEDIERHMRAKVLALIPHVPRITRNQLATLAADKKFSRFAESFAGLRGLLESPKYLDISKVVMMVSTQPEEGKTITASNLAVSYALAGRKTLLVDFDLRRPRIGRMFGKGDDIHHDQSLLDVLDAGDESKFAGMPLKSSYENLDLIVTRPTSHISPANAIGSQMLPKFFEWARANYDHVVIDSPPFGLVSDSLALGMLCDSVLVVCRPERSRYGAVNHALRSLAEAGSRIIGIVINDVDFGRSSTFGSYAYSSYSYGGYGGKYGYSGRYGRYGYSSNYYRRAPGDKSITAAKPSPGNATADDEDEGNAPRQTGVLDVDDDE